MQLWPLWGLFALACSPPAAVVKAPPLAPGGSPPAAQVEPRAPGRLEKSFTGAAAPALVVHNGYATVQHVFVDWAHRAALAPGAWQRFELAAGIHTITCADSPSPDDNPLSVTESFDVGYAYDYRVTSAR